MTGRPFPSLKHPACGFALESLPQAGPVSPVPRRELMSNSSVPRGPGLFEVGRVNGERLITNVRRVAGADRTPGSALVSAATILLGLLAAGLFVVTLNAQYKYVFAAKGQAVPSMIEAHRLIWGWRSSPSWRSAWRWPGRRPRSSGR